MTRLTWREHGDQMFSRAAGAPLIGGNRVELLIDARENYPRWLEAIRSATDHVHFENYYVRDDAAGRQFAEAFVAKAREGVRVRVLYEWFGNRGRAKRPFWDALSAAGVEVRCYNPPRLADPVGILSRDHRKMLVVDRERGFVGGLCVGCEWTGDDSKDIEPWRDTGVEIEGPAALALERAFSRTWALAGDPLPPSPMEDPPAERGDVNLRIVSSEPSTAGMLRLDQLVAGIARKRLWLSDAYYSGISSYVQALRAAALDGVDVRLLVPNATDIPALKPFSRAGYRALLDAGVRVFEWNGSMMHAKTAVADGRWARVGSTNLNIASWLGNCELDCVVEDETFAARMEEQYEQDVANSTEVVIDARRRVAAPGQPRRGPTSNVRRKGGSSTVAAAGAVRLGNAVGGLFIDRRSLGPVEARLATASGWALLALAVLVLIFPRALAYPAAAAALWGGAALLWRGVQLRRAARIPKGPRSTTGDG
jgi:cardiolipin synthase